MAKLPIQEFLNIQIHKSPVDFKILETEVFPNFNRQLVKYNGSETDEIRAYLFIPTKKVIIGSILVHHQHNAERHLGKSEVAGITGDPLQFFCPALAEKGIISLAPDSICFEDRRRNKKGIEPDTDPDDDVLQHYNEMCYRLLKGDLLMKKVIDDSSIGLSVLLEQAGTLKEKVGILGHSYGGNTVLFHSPFDKRIKYSCSSGAVCSYKTKFKFETGIELAEVIPNFSTQYDVEDLLQMIAPRGMLIVSSSLDIYSQDAKAMYDLAKPEYEKMGASNSIQHGAFEGEHALDQERFDYIVNWFVEQFDGKRN